MITNADNAATLVNEMAGLRAAERLPLICHCGITGGNFPALVGANLDKVDLAVVQTYSFIGAGDAVAHPVLEAARRLFGIEEARHVPAPVGMAHAYDLTRILALAIDRAGSTDRARVRDALEQVRDYPDLVRHDALDRADVFMARYAREDHAIVRIRP